MAPEHADTEVTPTKESVVTLRKVDKDNWRRVVGLTVTEGQAANVSTNAMSLCESHYSEDAWVRAIYADDTPVGFLMMSIWEPEDWYAIWRFMIDSRYQKLGLGGQAIQLAIDHVRQTYHSAKLLRLFSVGPAGTKGIKANDSPYYFYTRFGWKDISPLDKNGKLDMGLNL